MKTPDRDPPSDEDIDALLGSQLKDTTPEFEARWVAFRRRLRTGPMTRQRVPPWAGWLGLMSAGVTVAAILLALHPWQRVPQTLPALTPDLDSLFTMEAVLEPATALLDPENRDAFLNLPVNPPPHT